MASISNGPSKKYQFESRIQSTEYKKKIVYRPTIVIRTPTAEVLAFGGTLTHVFGRQLMIDVILDKIMEKQITLKSTCIFIFSIEDKTNK